MRSHDIRLQEVDNTSLSLENASNAVSMDCEGELVDLSQRNHVQCRIQGSKVSSNSVSSVHRNQRPVFLIVTPDVMSVGEVVQSQKCDTMEEDSKTISTGGLNQVRNSSVVPIHLVEAITDGSDPQTLHLTVFSHHRPKLFASIKYQGPAISDSPSKGGSAGMLALKCWRLTVSFCKSSCVCLDKGHHRETPR